MSSLTTEEVALESPLERDKDTEVTVTFKISAEALEMLVPKRATRRQFEEAYTVMLACGLYTRLQDIRDSQLREEVETHDRAGNVIVPGVRRKADLRRAGRDAQVALTHLETALLWGEKAASFIR